MKFTPQGVLLVAIIVGLSFSFYFNISVWISLGVLGVKYTLGERAALPCYKFLAAVMNFSEDLWFVLMSALLQLVLHTRVSYTVADTETARLKKDLRATGGPDLRRLLAPPSTPGKVKFIIVNHHCRLDWVYLFLFISRGTCGPSLRIILKEDLKKIPVFGWAMEKFRFLFLSRSWAPDAAYLEAMVSYFQRTGEAVTVLIFPEGTDLSLSNIEWSRAYAKKMGLPEFLHVLNPRTTGLVALKNMFGAENVEEILDCTIAYTYGSTGRRPSEPSLVNGSHAAKVHLLVRRCEIEGCSEAAAAASSPTLAPCGNDTAFAEWIHARFAEKEALLSRFYRNTPVGFDAEDVRAVYGDSSVVATYDDDANENRDLGYVRRYVREVGMWKGVGKQLLCWPIGAFYVMWFYPTLYVLSVYALLFAGVAKLLSACGGAQKILFLNQVSDEQTFLAKWKAWRVKKDN